MSTLLLLSDAKDFMQVTVATYDLLIQSYIDLTEAEIEAYTNRTLSRGTYTEVLSYPQSTFDQTAYTNLDAAQPAPLMFLDNTPIVSITSVNSGAIPASGYQYDANTGAISFTSQPFQPTVTYIAGYTTATAPADLKMVALLGVASLYRNNSAARQGAGDVKSKSIKDFSVTYGNESTGYLSKGESSSLIKNYIGSNLHILNKYRRVDL